MIVITEKLLEEPLDDSTDSSFDYSKILDVSSFAQPAEIFMDDHEIR